MCLRSKICYNKSNLSDPVRVDEAARDGVYDYLVKSDWRLEDVVKKVKEKLKQ